MSDKKMRELMRCLIRKGAEEELICAVIDILETDENADEMIAQIEPLKKPSRTCILGKAVLISDPE